MQVRYQGLSRAHARPWEQCRDSKLRSRLGEHEQRLKRVLCAVLLEHHLERLLHHIFRSLAVQLAHEVFASVLCRKKQQAPD